MNEEKKFNVLFDNDVHQPNAANASSGYAANSSSNPDLKRWSFSSEDSAKQSVNEVKTTAPLSKLQQIDLKTPGASKYRCEALSLFKIDNVVVSKSSTMTDFTITVVESNSHYTIVQITVQNTYLDNNIDELNSYNGLLKTIASVKDNMLLKIDDSGIITEVLNQDELKQKWLQVKADLLLERKFNSFKTEDQKLILQGGDDEYLKHFDMVSFINTGHTLYTMLFCGYWREYELQETYDLKPQIKKSALFKDQEIPLEVYGKIKRYINEKNHYQVEIQAIENRNFNTATLKTLYNQAYPFAKLEFDDYSYDYTTNIEADISTGWIKALEMTVIEQAGSIVMFMDCSIKQLNDEESNIAK